MLDRGGLASRNLISFFFFFFPSMDSHLQVYLMTLFSNL